MLNIKDKIKVQIISRKGKYNNAIEFIVPQHYIVIENCYYNVMSIINSLIVDIGYGKFIEDRKFTVYNDLLHVRSIFRFELTYEDILHKQFYSDYSYRKYESSILFRKF